MSETPLFDANGLKRDLIQIDLELDVVQTEDQLVQLRIEDIKADSKALVRDIHALWDALPTADKEYAQMASAGIEQRAEVLWSRHLDVLEECLPEGYRRLTQDDLERDWQQSIDDKGFTSVFLGSAIHMLFEENGIYIPPGTEVFIQKKTHIIFRLPGGITFGIAYHRFPKSGILICADPPTRADGDDGNLIETAP